MANTYPELTPPPFTPPSYDVARPPEQLVGSKSFLMTISVIVGIVVGISLIIGGIGKLAYVERSDYERKVSEIDRNATIVSEAIKSINSSQSRFEAAIARVENVLDRQSTDIQTIKVDFARGRR